MAVFKIGAQLQLFLFFLFEAAEVLPEDISRERKEYLERHGRRNSFLTVHCRRVGYPDVDVCCHLRPPSRTDRLSRDSLYIEWSAFLFI
jgi:hypothetical protein